MAQVAAAQLRFCQALSPGADGSLAGDVCCGSVMQSGRVQCPWIVPVTAMCRQVGTRVLEVVGRGPWCLEFGDWRGHHGALGQEPT